MRVSSWTIWLLLLFVRCIEPINFEVEQVAKQLIIEGKITDGEPPYIVKVSKALALTSDSLAAIPETSAVVTLMDDLGNSEVLVETDPGTYESSGIIFGRVGRAYHITVRTSEDNTFYSIPDTMSAVGSIQDIRFEYENRSVDVGYGEENQDVFNVFVDADGGAANNPNIRWKMSGVYKVITYPSLRMTEVVPYTPYKNPVVCSGYIVVEGLGGGKLLQIGPCTCCDCWAYQYIALPQLSSEFFVVDNTYQNVKVGEVPITNYTFHDKYRVNVEQMSLSNTAMVFFESVRAQKLSITDLFQPQVGELKGNIVSERTSDQVVGIFYATSVTEASTYIEREDIPYEVTPITFITEACYNSYENATTVKPEFWID